MFSLIWRVPRICLIGVVRFYQLAISPWLPSMCRFQPTCSAYAIEAFQKYGAVKGGWKTMWRLMRCQPFCKGGHDPP